MILTKTLLLQDIVVAPDAAAGRFIDSSPFGDVVDRSHSDPVVVNVATVTYAPADASAAVVMVVFNSLRFSAS